MLVEKNNLDIEQSERVSHIGFVIGPCLNAGGRLKEREGRAADACWRTGSGPGPCELADELKGTQRCAEGHDGERGGGGDRTGGRTVSIGRIRCWL